MGSSSVEISLSLHKVFTINADHCPGLQTLRSEYKPARYMYLIVWQHGNYSEAAVQEKK